MEDDRYKPAADALRILAILAVILIHTTTRTLEATGYALQETRFTLFLNQASRFAVPLFFMISGFVLELNYHTKEKYLIFLKKRLGRIIVPYIFWSVIYYYFIYIQGRNLNFLSSLLHGNASYQMYFIPSILIFYSIFPLIHKLIGMIGNYYVLMALFASQILLLFNDYNGHRLHFFYPLKIVFLNYFPFIFGIFLAKHYDLFIKYIQKWKILFGLLSLIFALLVYYEGYSGYLITHNYLKFYSQWRPSVLLYTIFLGTFLYWFFNKVFSNVSLIKTISKLSFFVFFAHIIILEKLWYLGGIKIFKLQYAQYLWWDPMYFLAVTLVSFAIAYVAHKLPYLSKLTG